MLGVYDRTLKVAMRHARLTLAVFVLTLVATAYLFTIIPKGKDAVAIDLEIDPLIQHGHVIEVTGKTELGARVMVNGHEVPIVTTDGGFHYFTPPLPTGESLITVTAQNSQGGVNTKQQKVVIQ